MRKKRRKEAVLLVYQKEGWWEGKLQGASSHSEFLAVILEAAQREPLQLGINHQTAAEAAHFGFFSHYLCASVST